MNIGESKPLIIEKNTSVYLPLYSLQTDPSFWEEPQIFSPERFMDKKDSTAKSNIYFPFGDGPRMCPGKLTFQVFFVLILFLSMM